MVRLKEAFIRSHCSIFHISIPYGAIKRKIIPLLCKEVNPFQFLMVRLKAEEMQLGDYRGQAFQFLMVRLKANGR